ncbi:MAG TPA: hypothetical protein VI248_28570 [Kineosporiaceae bacterium]
MVDMVDDGEGMAQVKAALNGLVFALVSAGSPGRTRRIEQEREPRVLRHPRIIQHDLEPVWDVGEILVTSVTLHSGEFTDGVTMMRMGISSHGELLSIDRALDRTTHYDYATPAEAQKALHALTTIARKCGVNPPG